MDSTIFTDITFEVSDFVSVINQTLDYAYPNVSIRGEIANFKISKNRWIYFDLKDSNATVHFFGTVFKLNGPLENGMLLRVRGVPKLHPQYGFSVTVLQLQPEGEGAFRRAADLLRAKLQAEGLFEEDRKRSLPYPPKLLGLITSTESAAYIDFIKILNNRWRGLSIDCIDIRVQGEVAPEQIIAAINYFNQKQLLPDVLILTRGGGSPEDLYAFDTEQVTRAVATSRVPTLVAIGHEKDTSLAELAADKRASTPSNAAELLVPDRNDILRQLEDTTSYMRESFVFNIHNHQRILARYSNDFEHLISSALSRSLEQLVAYRQILDALNPRAILGRGYSIVRNASKTVIHNRAELISGDIVNIELSDGQVDATIR